MNSWLPIAELAKEVQNSKLRASDLTKKALEAIKDKADYKTVIAVTEERANKRATEIDNKVKKGETVGRLAGVPFMAKDNFLAFGADTTAGSNILKGFVAPYQSTAIERLESEGAICVAKTNLDAFGHGASTENSDFMVTKNPHDKTRVSGGSSGGSAAAVALGIVPFALGTDTGGSIRQPAAFCGCIGYKPTYGLVSRSGVIAMGSSLDVIGPLTNNVEDASLILDVMAGRDDLDSTTIERDSSSYTDLEFDPTTKKVGIIKEYMSGNLDPALKKHVESSISKLEKNGVQISEVSLSSLPLALAAYYIICPAEVSSNLSRYDGQRFGYSDKVAKNLEESYTKSRSYGFGKEAKRRIIIGTYVLSSGYYDAYYRKAQTIRTKLINEFNKVFETVDFLIGPVTSNTAFKIGANASNPLQMYLEDIMTVAANLTGIPSLSLPSGDIEGLPVGVQLMAPQRADRALLGFAKHTEGLLL